VILTNDIQRVKSKSIEERDNSVLETSRFLLCLPKTPSALIPQYLRSLPTT